MIDTKWLKRIGVDLPEPQLNELTDKLASVLELQVGTVIAEKLSAEQLNQADRLMDEQGEIPLEWLEAAMPDYQADVEVETDRLRGMVEQSHDKAAFIRQLKG